MAKDIDPIWIYTWPKRHAHVSAEKQIISCAKDYAGRTSKKEALDTLVQPLAIARGERGKPCFAGIADIHFSLSHSGSYVVCAFHGEPVGLDLQKHTPCKRERIAGRFFHPDEYVFLEKRGFAGFFQVWAAKESYVKFTGTGITGAEGFRSFSVVAGDAMCSEANGVSYYHLDYADDYSLCLCAERIPSVAMTNLA